MMVCRYNGSPPPQPSPLKGEGVSRAVVGAPPSGRFVVRSGGVARSGVGSPSDGTPNQSTKPASGQVAGYPQPSHPQGVRRWVPRCFAATLPQPIEGEGAWRAVVGAPPSGRFSTRSGGVARSSVASPPDGTTNHSTKPASGQVAGKPQPSLAAAMVRCSPPPQPSPLKGEGVSRTVVGAPPTSGRVGEGALRS